MTCARRRPVLSEYFWRVGPGRWLLPDNRWIKAHYYMGEYDFQEVKRVDIISGSCMLIRSNLLREIGLLDENTFLYLEEFILHEKVRKTRYFTVIAPHSRIAHKGRSSIGEENYRAVWESLKSLSYYLWNYRNFGRIATISALTSVAVRMASEVLRIFMRNRVGK